MALKILQPGIQPLGQFDVLDSYLSGIKGGEIVTLYAADRVNSASEKAAHDVLDGYTNLTDVKRAAVANSITGAAQRPLWLADDGTTGYGTLFGQVIGTPTGLSTTGTNLGPHTAAGSGKVTCWDKPGLYAVSVDAVDTSVDGLVIANSACDPGLKLDCTPAGLLTPYTAGDAVGIEVGRFVEFETSPSLVNTPASLVGATEAAVNAIFHYFVV